MGPLYSPALPPHHGMSREDCDALRRDLEAAGIEVVRVEEPSPGVFWLVYHNAGLRVNETVTNAALFRELWAGGLHEGLPPPCTPPDCTH